MSDGGAPKDYASPLMRKAVHDRMRPGAWVEYAKLPIGESDIPVDYRQGSKPPTHVIRCTIIYPDGQWVSADREIDVELPSRDGKARVVPHTPEMYFAYETKALGRALSRAGIPHRLSELQSLMRWAVALSDQPAPAASPPATPTAAPTPTREETPPSPAATFMAAFSALPDTLRAVVTRTAREQHGITNIAAVRDPDKIQLLEQLLDNVRRDVPHE